MAGNTVNSEIQRLKQNVADSYSAIEQNMGKPVTDEHVSEYVNENISEIGRHLQAVVTDDTVTMDVDLDDYEIIDLTNLDGNLQDKVITQNGEYTYDAGYTGLRNVTVALDIDEKPEVITRDGVYLSSDDNLGGYNKVVVEYDITNQDKTITQNGVYTKDSGYDGLGTVTVALPLDSKTIQHNGVYNASSDNLEGFTSVNVQVPIDAKPAVITRNGTYNASYDNLDGYSSVYVSYDSHNQNKTVTTNGDVTFDAGYDGLGTVTVDLPLDSKTIEHNGTYPASSDNLEGFDEVTVNVPLGPKTITRNGTYTATDDNVDGYNTVTVDYDFHRQDKTITQNGTYTFDAGYDGLGTVEVALQVGPKPTTITANGTYSSATDDLAGYSSFTVDVDVNNENRTFTQNGVYTPTAGYNGMYQVTVDVPASTYLNNIRTVLINQGLTPPADDADLATYINTVFNNITNELQSVNGSN